MYVTETYWCIPKKRADGPKSPFEPKSPWRNGGKKLSETIRVPWPKFFFALKIFLGSVDGSGFSNCLIVWVLWMFAPVFNNYFISWFRGCFECIFGVWFVEMLFLISLLFWRASNMGYIKMFETSCVVMCQMKP